MLVKATVYGAMKIHAYSSFAVGVPSPHGVPFEKRGKRHTLHNLTVVDSLTSIFEMWLFRGEL